MTNPAIPDSLKSCPVCGGSRFTARPILWPELVEAWELSPEEVAYTDLQQGLDCQDCAANLRSMTLAAAVLRQLGRATLTFRELCARDEAWRGMKVLELNPAGHLANWLPALPHHRLGSYPEVDMQSLPFPADSWDAVLHSDTLEHVPDPDRALAECHRVLKPGGWMAFTIPIIHGRLTRSCAGRPPSYHGGPGKPQEDFRVATEYGADFYAPLLAAGFTKVELHSIVFPASVAILAVKSDGAATLPPADPATLPPPAPPENVSRLAEQLQELQERHQKLTARLEQEKERAEKWKARSEKAKNKPSRQPWWRRLLGG